MLEDEDTINDNLEYTQQVDGLELSSVIQKSSLLLPLKLILSIMHCSGLDVLLTAKYAI